MPRLARLKRRRTSRIFQDQTTREIIEQVLSISRVESHWAVHHEPKKRAYCVQYDETDYAFVTRMAAADGLFFWFEHDSGAEERVVFADHCGAYKNIEHGHDLVFRPPGADGSALTSTADHVQRFELRHASTPERVLLRRFDFESPVIPQRDFAGIDSFASPENQEAMRHYVDAGSTIYEHQNTREQALLDPIGAQTVLDAEIREAALANGLTHLRRLAPGRRFRLSDHPVAELDQDYVVVACNHECHDPAFTKPGESVYTNTFGAVPAEVAFRPDRPRRQVRQSLETATVVGPAGEEIHTDELGRIRVQFHWDLQGQNDDKSSCWLRVAQAWAGSGYGAQFLPRIGQEVLVGYIDGDTDRPVVLGSLHNGVQRTPFSLPRDQTQSGFRTFSSPGGAGSNEVLLDDKAGAELVSLRSNRTMNLSAVRDANLSAGSDLSIACGADRTDRVLGHADTTIRPIGSTIPEIGKLRKYIRL